MKRAGMFTRDVLFKLIVVALEALGEAFVWLAHQIKNRA